MAATGFLAFLVLVFAGVVGCQLLGHRIAKQRRAHGSPAFGDATTAVQGSLFALLGLMVAFTISGGQDRLDARRRLVVEEANAIGTAYLRLDLLPPAAQPALRDEFRRYADARIAYFAKLPKLGQAKIEHQRAGALQQQIWRHTLAAVGATPDTRPALLLLPAVNAMIDVTTVRDAALRTHAPVAIFILLLLLSFMCAFFAGAEMAKNDRPSMLHVVAFASTLALTTYVVVNIELPRLGFTSLAPIDALLAQVRQQMN
jgi:hypothetical protein